jgi:hypothetical protein
MEEGPRMGDGIDSGLVHVGRAIRAEEVALIEETVELFPALSRSELAETICDHLGWYTASGSYKRQACLDLLQRLEAQGMVQLPERRPRSPRRRAATPRWTPRTDPGSELTGRLGELGGVQLRVVEDRREREVWNEYVSRYHYLGYKPPAGFRLRYFVESERGCVGCVLLGGAARAIAVRDRWIGWTRGQRLSNLGWVVNNTRFLLFPWVRVRYLASHVLGQLARQVGADWGARWGYQPVLLETFVDPARYRATSYRAAGWERLGQTTGKGLSRRGQAYRTTVKGVYVRPLVRGFREQLRSESLGARELER